MFNKCLKHHCEEHASSLVHLKSCEIIFKFWLTLEVLPVGIYAEHNLSRGLLFLVRLNINLLNLSHSCNYTGVSSHINDRCLQYIKLGRFKRR